jgi:hypothetical protein
MKEQNRCFTDRYFEIPAEVEVKLPVITASYVKNGSFYLFSSPVASPLSPRRPTHRRSSSAPPLPPPLLLR